MVNCPVREVKVITVKLLPSAGTKPLMSVPRSVPASLAADAPVRLSRSCSVPGFSPPNSMSVMPPGSWVKPPVMLSVPADRPGDVRPPVLLTLPVIVPFPSRLPPWKLIVVLEEIAPPSRMVLLAVCAKPPVKLSVWVEAWTSPELVNGMFTPVAAVPPPLVKMPALMMEAVPPNTLLMPWLLVMLQVPLLRICPPLSTRISFAADQVVAALALKRRLAVTRWKPPPLRLTGPLALVVRN